jgi:hypothetical protein
MVHIRPMFCCGCFHEATHKCQRNRPCLVLYSWDTSDFLPHYYTPFHESRVLCTSCLV